MMDVAKILLVDDEPDIVYLVRRFLERGGYFVVEANGGREALKKAEKENPDLVLMDVMMPDLDGWEVSRSLKSREDTRNIPIVMLTVRTSLDSRQKSKQYAFADAHIGKPASGKNILSTVDAVLNRDSNKIAIA
jgi:CheY-like chemotaxis protein